MVQIGKLISNIGVPIALIIYFVWRLDKFLTQLCDSLNRYNKELGTIGSALTQLVEYTKGLTK